MEYRDLGRAGVKVSAICLGNMNFGGSADEHCSRSIMDHAVDKGINFFDTANVYVKSESEKVLGRWLHDGGANRRDKLVIATKVYGRMGEGQNDRGLSRRHILKACDDSLSRLKTDRIDLYQCHHWDMVSIEETIRAMDDLIRAGKVIYWGTSNFKAWQLMEATLKAEGMHAPVPATEQCPYSITNRHVETELAPFLHEIRREDAALVAIECRAVVRGMCAGKPIVESPRNKSPEWRGALEKNMGIIEGLASLAEGQGKRLGQLAYAFLLSHPHVASVIVGPRTNEHLDEALSAADWKLDEATRKKIDEIVPVGTSPDYIGW